MCQKFNHNPNIFDKPNLPLIKSNSNLIKIIYISTVYLKFKIEKNTQIDPTLFHEENSTTNHLATLIAAILYYTIKENRQNILYERSLVHSA